MKSINLTYVCMHKHFGRCFGLRAHSFLRIGAQTQICSTTWGKSGQSIEHNLGENCIIIISGTIWCQKSLKNVFWAKKKLSMVSCIISTLRQPYITYWNDVKVSLCCLFYIQMRHTVKGKACRWLQQICILLICVVHLPPCTTPL